MKRILSLITGLLLCISAIVAQGSFSFGQFNQYNANTILSNTDQTVSDLLKKKTSPYLMPYTAAKHVEFKYHGVYCVTDLAMAYDLTEKVFLRGLNISGGWQWRRHSGFGVGVTYFSDAEGVFSQMPIYAEIRSHILRNQVTPFTSITAGYTLPMGRKNGTKELKREVIQGGVMVGLSIGARYAFNRNMAVNAYIGYQLQSLRVQRVVNSDLENADVNYYKIEESIIQNFIKFGFGVNF